MKLSNQAIGSFMMILQNAILNGEVVLEPGGYHIMLMGLAHALEEGSSFPLTLTFEKAGSLEIDVPVQGPGAMGHGEQMNHDGHKNHDGQMNHGANHGN